jgi:hypothetical protein
VLAKLHFSRTLNLAASLLARLAKSCGHVRPHCRRSNDHPHEQCWLIYYGDIHAGTISERTGNPYETEPWEWQCGFYPGARPGECTSGTAKTFDQARADFEAAWKVFFSNRTDADLQACRDQEAWTAEKYRRFDRGERMPPDWRKPLIVSSKPSAMIGSSSTIRTSSGRRSLTTPSGKSSKPTHERNPSDFSAGAFSGSYLKPSYHLERSVRALVEGTSEGERVL